VKYREANRVRQTPTGCYGHESDDTAQVTSIPISAVPIKLGEIHRYEKDRDAQAKAACLAVYQVVQQTLISGQL
jgi:hypothetical protein